MCLAPSPPAQVPSKGCQPCSAGERVKKGREGISPPRGPEEGGGHRRGRCGLVTRHCRSMAALAPDLLSGSGLGTGSFQGQEGPRR